MTSEQLVTRFLEENAHSFAVALRRVATQLDQIAPGSPAIATPVWFTRNERIVMGDITVKDSDQQFGGSVSFLDAKGAPTQPDDVPQWSSSDENVATVAASEDGRSATVTPVLPGAAIISVDSNDTDGTHITAQGTVTVQPGEAVIGEVTFAPPGA